MYIQFFSNCNYINRPSP